ncbi:MAG: formylglycine-generating enzyme family protein [Vicinamibacterales bacterium]
MREELLPRFVEIPAGEFVMGAPDGEDDERPVRRVTLDRFFIGTHAVTNAQYAEFVRNTGHRAPDVRDLPSFVAASAEAAFRELASPYIWRGGDLPRDRGTHPVTLVTHADAVAYCVWLGTRLGRAVRLPSEAEWERAARGGIDHRRYPWGDEIDPSRSNFLPDVALKRMRGTRPVGTFPPNPFGLYDASGNVWEWVADWYAPDAYATQGAVNPPGPVAGTMRVLRGGSWVTHDVLQLRCAYRHKVPPDTYAYSVGFRVAYSDVPEPSDDAAEGDALQ